MSNEVLAKLRGTADKLRVQRAERPAAPHRLDEGLDVVWGNGTRTGIRFSQFLWTRLFSPESLTIHFSTHTVVVKGERLASIYELVLSQRLRTLKQSDAAEIEEAKKKGGPVIETLYVLPKAGNLIEVEPEDQPPVAATGPAPLAEIESKIVGPDLPDGPFNPVPAEQEEVLPLLELMVAESQVDRQGSVGDPPDDDVSDLSML